MVAVDYAWSKPSVAALRGVGATGVLRYLSWLPNGKVISADEYRQLRQAGIEIALNWEYDSKDWLGGAAKGSQHAAEAVKQARALGYPAGAGIYGSADFDMTRAQWDAAGRAYATAFRDGIRAGGYREGVYGPYDVLAWCREIGYRLFWQAGMSTAWSGGRNRNAFPGAHLRQRRTQLIGGADCDVNDILASDYGQHGGEEDFMSALSDAEQREILSWTRVLSPDKLKRLYLAVTRSEHLDGHLLAGTQCPGNPTCADDFDGWQAEWGPAPAGTALEGPPIPTSAPVVLSDADRAAIVAELAQAVGPVLADLRAEIAGQRAELDQVKTALGAAGREQAKLGS